MTDGQSSWSREAPSQDLLNEETPFFLWQVQAEREKLAYDYDQIQSQLDKAHGQSARLAKERETLQLEADRLREKHDKVQVS